MNGLESGRREGLEERISDGAKIKMWSILLETVWLGRGEKYEILGDRICGLAEEIMLFMYRSEHFLLPLSPDGKHSIQTGRQE